MSSVCLMIEFFIINNQLAVLVEYMNKNGKYSLVFAIFIACILLTGVAVAEKKGGGGGGGGSKPECNDKIDNDGDGYTDMDDDGCSNRKDKDETNCGDGECEGGEDSSSCSADCGPSSYCGDGTCDAGESCSSCSNDCGQCDSCSDTDGGSVIGTYGTVSGYLNDNAYSSNDYCADSSNVREYYCSGNAAYSTQQSCGTDSTGSNYCSGNEIYQDVTDYFCSNGECDNSVTAQLQTDCDDLDNYGADYCSDGDVYHNYNNFYCNSGGCANTTTPYIVESCAYGCTSGECDIMSDSCSDTDGGNTSTTYGTVSGYRNNNPYSRSDYCVGSTSIVEYYCLGDLDAHSQQSCGTDYSGSNYCSSGDVYRDSTDYYCSSGECDSAVTTQLIESCTYGCTSGSCDSPADSCSDTDNGIYEYITGTVSGYVSGETYSETDTCFNSSVVNEQFCSGNYANTTMMFCRWNETCSSGRCS